MSFKLSKSSRFKLLDGQSTPVLGLGVYQVLQEGEVEGAVLAAIRNGYKMIDTSAYYGNEEEIGSAIRKSGVNREAIYITTKLWNDSHGRDETFKAFQESLRKLELQYIDRYMIHSAWGGKVLESWEAMIELQRQGLVKSIGVANFSIEHLKELKRAFPSNIPVVNQIEINMHKRHPEVVEYCKNEGILVEAYYTDFRGIRIDDYTVDPMSQRYDKTVTQMMVRWALQHGFVVITKAHDPDKVKAQGDVFDIHLSDEDMAALDAKHNNPPLTGYARWDPLSLPWKG